MRLQCMDSSAFPSLCSYPFSISCNCGIQHVNCGSRLNFGLCTTRRSSSQFPLPFRFTQPMSQLPVLSSVLRPPLCRAIPAMVLDGHVDAAVDEELHRLVVPMPDELVQDTCRLMG